ncbi:enoyl-CoA hydratase [Limnohabitans sp.]|jgi:enoyl-CoA hydratase/carnithine racemase|uniref:enoyl-CoA hydratase n=1 Tax=Limnohabitans sp. TaxID=1907725 RepID=UPI0037C07406
MTAGRIDLVVEGHVAQITIDDTERHNAMSLAMWTDLLQAFEEVDQRPEVRVCVLRGAGEKSFVSGANIGEFETQRNSADSVAHYNQMVKRAQQAIFRCRVPVIAAISGICYGGGLGLALSCDMRYAAPHSRFRMPAARMGLGYDCENMKSILNNLGPQATAEAFYTAKVYDAPSAQAMGMVLAVVDDVFAHCTAMAHDIAANAPLTIQAAKKTLVALAEDEKDMTSVKTAIDACFKSTDYAEGRLAFAQKRPPHFTGH